jgi:signal transduction histidine kinase
MTIRSWGHSESALRAAQVVSIISIAVLAGANAGGYDGVLLGGILLTASLLIAIAAVVSAFDQLSSQQRDLFGWITLGAAMGTLAKISWTAHVASNGVPPTFPALADYLLLGTEVAVAAGLGRMLYANRGRVGLVDVLLMVVTAAAILLPLGTFPAAIPLGNPTTTAHVIGGLSILAAITSLVLLAMVVTWHGDDLSRRTMLGLIAGTIALAILTAWFAQLGLSGTRPAQISMDFLIGVAILGFVSALDIRRPMPTLELRVAERTAALSGTVEELKGVITEERAMRAQIIERERLASIGSIVGGVAHEINNPLSSISAFAQLLLTEKNLTESQRDSLDAIYAEATRAANVIRDLRAFARRSASESRAVDLNEIIGRTVRLRSYQMDSGNVQVLTELDANLPMVTGDPQQLQQVVVSLMSSAIVSMKDGGLLRVVTRAERVTEGKHVLAEFTDTGPGIPEELRERIFDPFLRVQGFGEGVGMGLSVSYGIVAAHGGSLRLADGSQGNTRFVVELPAARWQPDAAVVPTTSHSSS